MFIEVLIVLNRDEFFPSIIPKRLTLKSYPYSRIGEIVDLYKKNTKSIRSEDYRETEREKYENGIFRFYGDNYSCFTYDPYRCENVTYAIEKIDTANPWTIVKSDKGERIKYFDSNEKYKIIDENLNYGEAL